MFSSFIDILFASNTEIALSLSAIEEDASVGTIPNLLGVGVSSTTTSSAEVSFTAASSGVASPLIEVIPPSPAPASPSNVPDPTTPRKVGVSIPTRC